MRTAFIGHGLIYDKRLNKKVLDAVQTEIDNGCREFTMGIHGNFDAVSLYTCKLLRCKYPDVKIEVVLTSFTPISKHDKDDEVPFSDVDTIMYDIEEVHFKRKIIESNRQMIDRCDTLICYVDSKRYYSGAKKALAYAKKRGLKIINLYRPEDELYYIMTGRETSRYIRAERRRTMKIISRMHDEKIPDKSSDEEKDD